MKKFILMGMLLLAPLMAEKFDPRIYEQNLLANNKTFQDNYKATVDKCRVYAKKAREYRAYLDREGRDDAYAKATIESCQERIRTFCGAVIEAQTEN